MDIPTSLVAKLVGEQFPQWMDLQVGSVEHQGNDNRTFRLGEELSCRLPSAEAYAAHVPIEHEWLPRLAPKLPFPIPDVVGCGVPALDFPWPWTVNKWIVGETASLGNISNVEKFAQDLAGFLLALQAIDGTDGPTPGKENFYRGGDLEVYDGETRASLKELQCGWDTTKLENLWDQALSTKWDDAGLWLHGDIAPGNLLFRDGGLRGVIDFGQLAVGDPACDLAIAWTFFRKESRGAFREALGARDDLWNRAKGWALWKAAITKDETTLREITSG